MFKFYSITILYFSSIFKSQMYKKMVKLIYLHMILLIEIFNAFLVFNIMS